MKIFLSDKTVITEIRHIGKYGSESDERVSHYAPCSASCELIYNVSGVHRTEYLDKIGVTHAGDLRFLPITQKKGKYIVTRIENGVCFDVFFNMTGEFQNEMVILKAPERERVGSLYEKMYSVWKAKNVGYYEHAMSLFYEVIRIIKKSSENSYVQSGKYEIIRPAVEYMRMNYSAPDFDYSLLPALCGVSYSYFGRLFSTCMGMSPREYITKLRLESACEMLLTGRMTVKYIAHATGFDDECYFSRIFSARYGKSPREYMHSE